MGETMNWLDFGVMRSKVTEVIVYVKSACCRDNLRTVWWINFKLGSCVHVGRTMNWLDIEVMRSKIKGHRGHSRNKCRTYVFIVFITSLAILVNVEIILMIWLMNRFGVIRSKVTEVIVYVKSACCRDNLRTVWWINIKLGSCVHVRRTMNWLDIEVMGS